LSTSIHSTSAPACPENRLSIASVSWCSTSTLLRCAHRKYAAVAAHESNRRARWPGGAPGSAPATALVAIAIDSAVAPSGMPRIDDADAEMGVPAPRRRLPPATPRSECRDEPREPGRIGSDMVGFPPWC
jgi:hypothetical protein